MTTKNFKSRLSIMQKKKKTIRNANTIFFFRNQTFEMLTPLRYISHYIKCSSIVPWVYEKDREQALLLYI